MTLNLENIAKWARIYEDDPAVPPITTEQAEALLLLRCEAQQRSRYTYWAQGERRLWRVPIIDGHAVFHRTELWEPEADIWQPDDLFFERLVSGDESAVGLTCIQVDADAEPLERSPRDSGSRQDQGVGGGRVHPADHT